MLNKKILIIFSILLTTLLFFGCSSDMEYIDSTNTFNEEITILDKSNTLAPEESIIEKSKDNIDIEEESIVSNGDTSKDIITVETENNILTENNESTTVDTVNKEEIIVEKTTDSSNAENEITEITQETTDTTPVIIPETITEGKDVVIPETTIKEDKVIVPEEETTTEHIVSEVTKPSIDVPAVPEEIPQKILPNNPTIIMDKIDSVESFLKAPTEADFGDNYERALNLYNAILNKQSEIEIHFDTDWNDMSNFIGKFEELVMHNLFVITRTVTSGGKNYIECWPENIYNEILAFNDYRNIIISLGIDEYVDQKDAVIKINNWIIDYLNYEASQNDAYLAFVNKKANCDGYARLFQRFCKIIGVECTWESGRVKSGGAYGLHAWNKVKLDDVWYYIDVCWNDSTSRNRYLLSQTLWYNHTSKVDVNIVVPENKDLGKTIHFINDISINDILTEPTQNVFGINYDAAMALYLGIINDEKYVVVELLKENTDIDSYSAYDVFAAKFKKYVLNSAMDLQYASIMWKTENVKLTANTYGMRKQLQFSLDEFDEYHKANLAAGVKDGMTEMEAIVKILNWMTRNLEYDNYASKNSIEALTTGQADYRWYAEIFYYMCKDIGVDCEIINGRHIPDGRRVAALWNKVKIGETWYYTDLWYYSITSYKDAEKLEYFLSEELWEDHITDLSING